MIRALLSGRKTQTRRAVKPQPFVDGYYAGEVSFDSWEQRVSTGEDPIARFSAEAVCGGAYLNELVSCPYGPRGTLLWVRETWTTDNAKLRFRADYSEIGHDKLVNGRWRSPIHMPKWASRLTLELTDVRMERVADISEEDARAEGIHELPLQAGKPGAWWTADASAGPDLHGRTPVAAFAELWDSIHGIKTVYSWADSPWVWVLSFRTIRANVDAVIGEPAGYGVRAEA